MHHSLPPQPEELAAGTLIAANYRVEACLGRGGKGDVYRVTDERTGQRLALKRRAPAARGADTTLAFHFEREYHTLCELAHPRIIEVYDFGVSSVGAFYTMELLDGQDLRERGRLPWRQASALLVDVASSLAIIHFAWISASRPFSAQCALHCGRPREVDRLRRVDADRYGEKLGRHAAVRPSRGAAAAGTRRARRPVRARRAGVLDAHGSARVSGTLDLRTARHLDQSAAHWTITAAMHVRSLCAVGRQAEA